MDEREKGFVTLPELKKGLAGSFTTKECEEIFRRELKKRKFHEGIQDNPQAAIPIPKKLDVFYLDNIDVKITGDSRLFFQDFIRMIQPPDFDVNWDVLDRTIKDELLPQYKYPKEQKKVKSSSDEALDRLVTGTSLDNN